MGDVTSLTPLQALEQRAKSLLAQPDMSATEIAMKLGFREGSSLTSAFRRFTGRTPNDYRRSLE